MDLFIKNIEQRLKAPLPGLEAQFKMAHVVRRTNYDIPDDARRAGVLALFYPKEQDWNLVFIERVSSNRMDRHSGQISFPGGKYEDGDGDLITTAIRETEEEIGVPTNDVKVLGELSQMYIPVSNFLVHPCVGFLEYTPIFVPEQAEVHDIIEVPFGRFLKPETAQVTKLKLSNNIVLNQVPYYDLYGKVLWGATAMIMSELIEAVG